MTKLVNVARRCGGDRVDDQQGLLWSPNYPRHYPNDLQCMWRIIAQPGEIIRVTVEELDLVQNDTLIIVDGNFTNFTSSIVLAELTGKIVEKKTLQSHSHLVTILLSTDGNYRGKGFWLKYRKHLISNSSTTIPPSSDMYR